MSNEKANGDRYQPDFDTTTGTQTVTKRIDTLHTNWIDWDHYPFFAREHTDGMCCDDEGKQQRVQQKMDYLRLCEQHADKEVYASNYGGWPRIWKRVIGVGMASKWPYWTPRPTVIVNGTLGTEWYDWASLTGAECR